MRYYILAVVTGLSFAAWPLVMSRSGLSGPFASWLWAMTIAFVVGFTLPLFGQTVAHDKGSFLIALLAGLIGAIGVLALNTICAKASQAEIGKYFLIMLVVQFAVPAVYHMVMSGELTVRKVAGILAGFIALWLLASK